MTRPNRPTPPPRQKFSLGRLVITGSAKAVLDEGEVTIAIRRHAVGDWGELCEEDQARNERALRDGARLLSSYRSGRDVVFWIITEADRSATTVLLPEDY